MFPFAIIFLGLELFSSEVFVHISFTILVNLMQEVSRLLFQGSQISTFVLI
jgi:hypothetical protein